MGEVLSKLFIPLHSLPGLYSLPDQCLEPEFVPEDHLNPTFGGIFQLLFIAVVYGQVLKFASDCIADGSELLLLIPEIAPVVGSVVLPVLGAVPDGAIVLFSGLGDKAKAQESLSVGVGALAGSTIMLLTVPWGFSILAGRVNIENGQCTYKKPKNAANTWKKLDDSNRNWLTQTGIQPDERAMVSGARVMLLTSFSYFLIQGAAFAFEGDPDQVIVKHEQGFALAGLIYCAVTFVLYLYQQIRHKDSDKVLQDIVDAKREEALRAGMLSLQGAFFNALDFQDQQESPALHLLEKEHQLARFDSLVRKFFRKYDVNGDGSIDVVELKLLLEDLHIPHSDEQVKQYLKEMDKDNDGMITLTEFTHTLAQLVSQDFLGPSHMPNYGATDHMSTLMEFRQSQTENQEHAVPREDARHESQENEEEEEEEMPEDIANLPPEEQRRRILFRSFNMMGIGTVLVLLFSDPMVDVLSEIGSVVHVPAFYVSFLLAPLASNACELIASVSYARKKTTKSITIGLSSLEGAAIMNNTFCLGIFLALVYFRGLKWSFSAETIAILVVEMTMFFVANMRVQRARVAFFVLALFPASMLLVAFLENVLGLD